VTLPVLKLVAVSAARSYKFYPVDQERHWAGWAICTINDETGELSIQSDWGSWQHRWSSDPKHLGAATLTAFIARREHDGYLADKLTTDGVDRNVFDADATVRAARREVLRMRRGTDRRTAIDKDEARDLWEALSELLDCHDVNLFLERFYNVEVFNRSPYGDPRPSGLTRIWEEPWHMLEHRNSQRYEILFGSILPALREALRAEAAAAAPAPDTQPAVS
jgi:hypothetical protein